MHRKFSRGYNRYLDEEEAPPSYDLNEESGSSSSSNPWIDWTWRQALARAARIVLDPSAANTQCYVLGELSFSDMMEESTHSPAYQSYRRQSERVSKKEGSRERIRHLMHEWLWTISIDDVPASPFYIPDLYIHQQSNTHCVDEYKFPVCPNVWSLISFLEMCADSKPALPIGREVAEYLNHNIRRWIRFDMEIPLTEIHPFFLCINNCIPCGRKRPLIRVT